MIKIRGRFPTRKVLFDVGVAGPIAGFVVMVPALFYGLHLSTIVILPTEGIGVAFGDPILLQWATHVMLGTVPDGYTVNWHPIVLAAWFAMLATSFNLLPFGQFDGGHLTYATLGRVSKWISIATAAAAFIMIYFSVSWVLMTIIMLLMLRYIGAAHPAVLNEYEPLPRSRWALAAGGVSP